MPTLNFALNPIAPPPPPPTTIDEFLGIDDTKWDYFNRADNTSLGKVESDVWRTWVDLSGDLRIVSNTVRSASGAGVLSLTRVSGGFIFKTPDQWAMVRGILRASGDAVLCGVRKAQDSVQTYYAARWRASGSSGVIELLRVVSGSATVIASGSYGGLNAWHDIQVSVKGTTVSLYVDEVKKLQVTDTAITGGSATDVIVIGAIGGGEIDHYISGIFPERLAAPPGATYRPGTRVPWIWMCHEHSIWNRSIGSNAVYVPVAGRLGAALQAATTFGFNTTAYSINVFKASPTDPMVPLYNYNSSYGGYTHRWTVRCPTNATPSAGTDGNIVIVDENQEYLYEGSDVEAYLGGWRSNGWKRTRVKDHMRFPGYHGSCEDGNPSPHMLIRAGEATSGFFHCINAIVHPNNTRKAWRWPANQVGSFDSWDPDPLANVIHGSLLAIPPEVNVPGLGFVYPQAQRFVQAWQDFGLRILDKGSVGALLSRVEPAAIPDAPWSLTAFRQDVARGMKWLKVVDNDASATPAGGGTPRVPLPPPFA